MIQPFSATESSEAERTIYLPMELFNIVCREMRAAGARFRAEVIHRLLLAGRLPVTRELLSWKERFEADGYGPTAEDAYDRVTSRYDPERIYRYSRQFFGPTIDADYRRELEDALRFNRALALAEDRMDAGE